MTPLIPEHEILAILARLHQMPVLRVRVYWPSGISLDRRIEIMETAQIPLPTADLYQLRHSGHDAVFRAESMTDAYGLFLGVQRLGEQSDATVHVLAVGADGSKIDLSTQPVA